MVLLAAAVALVGAQEAAQSPSDLASPALRVSYAEFKRLYDAGKVLVIDTRDRASFDMGHIPGARNIPVDEIAQHVEELRREKRAIVTYCS